MIHYALICRDGHDFDGWFRSSAGFEEQAGAGMLSCPVCGGVEVTRALMTPGVPRKGKVRIAAPEQPAAPAAPLATPAKAAVAVPDAVRGMLQRLRGEIEKHCDYVGPSFAAEARKIHEGDAKVRPIYGEATPDEAAALQEDGVEVSSIPWLPRADA